MGDTDRHELIRQAVETWGDALAAWCLGVTLTEFNELRLPFTAVPEQMSMPLHFLAEAAREIPKVGERNPLRATAIVASRLLRFFPKTDVAAVNALRVASGGALPDPEHTDPLVAALRHLALDSVPAYLLLHAGSGGPDLDREVLHLGHYLLFEDAPTDHRALTVFTDRFANDDGMAPLRDVMSQEDQTLRRLTGRGFASESAYLSGSAAPDPKLVRPTSLARELIEAAWDRHLLSGPADVFAALECIEPVVDELRAGLAGRSITVPALIGLRGLAFDSATATIEIKRATVRPPTDAELRFTGDSEGVGAVCEVRLPARLHLSSDSPSRPHLHADWSRPPLRDLLQRGNEIALAATLASRHKRVPAVSVAWVTVMGPIGQAFPSERDAARVDETAILDEDGRAELASWVAHVRRVASGALPAVAQRRSVSALHERRDYADGVVDALIALEAIMGGGASLRIEAAVAWLLEPDSVERRAQRFAQVGELYRKRSAVVHRGARATRADWIDATSTLREVLRRLLTSHRHLLAADRRGDLLLLGGGAQPIPGSTSGAASGQADS